MSLPSSKEYNELEKLLMERIGLQDYLVLDIAEKLSGFDDIHGTLSVLATKGRIEQALYATAVSTGSVPQCIAIVIAEFLLCLEDQKHENRRKVEEAPEHVTPS